MKRNYHKSGGTQSGGWSIKTYLYHQLKKSRRDIIIDTSRSKKHPSHTWIHLLAVKCTNMQEAKNREWIKSIISYKMLLYSEQKQLWQIQFPPTEGDLHV